MLVRFLKFQVKRKRFQVKKNKIKKNKNQTKKTEQFSLSDLPQTDKNCYKEGITDNLRELGRK